jgi:hypothetical protein
MNFMPVRHFRKATEGLGHCDLIAACTLNRFEDNRDGIDGLGDAQRISRSTMNREIEVAKPAIGRRPRLGSLLVAVQRHQVFYSTPGVHRTHVEMVVSHRLRREPVEEPALIEALVGKKIGIGHLVVGRE